MGSITRSFANNIGSSGTLVASAVTNATVEDITVFGTAPSPSTLVLISTQTASSSATISFTTGLDSTYDEYIFKFINIHPSGNNSLTVNFSTDGGSNYNVTKTTTFFVAYNNEAGTSGVLQYDGGSDLAQSTAAQIFLALEISNSNDGNASGYLQLFNPSSTTYVKHFIARINGLSGNPADYSHDNFVAGYCNTTSAVNAVQFSMTSGNIDDGIIKLYGVKKS